MESTREEGIEEVTIEVRISYCTSILEALSLRRVLMFKFRDLTPKFVSEVTAVIFKTCDLCNLSP